MSTPHILIVDDDSLIRETVLLLLEDIAATKQTAHDGVEALQWLNTESFNLVITDNNMPGMSGIELLERMRNMERFKNIPVLLQSGDATPEVIAQVQKLGGVFLRKPSDKLLETVEALLVPQK